MDRGTLSVLPLASGRHLIGRDPGLGVVLDDARVSKLHAALVRDPCGRWWIHDLGSTNGTYVNGAQITLRFVGANDAIEIGRYRLTIRIQTKANDRPTVPPTPPSSSRTAAPITTRLPAASADRLSTVLALDALESARSLLLFEDRALRLNALCERSVAERFPGLWSAAVRVNRIGPATLISGPVSRGHTPALLEGQERRLLSSCEERRHELLGRSIPSVIRARDGSGDCWLGSALATFPDGAEMLFVRLGKESDPEEWSSVYALLAASFRYASELWDTRGRFGLNAAIEREFETARQLQESLIPRCPVVPGLDLAIGYEPSRWVGGDYADAVPMRDGRVLLTIADVCGKGLQAALVASSLHTLVHVLAESGSLVDIARRMNAYLCSCLPEHSFVTMVFIAVDARRGELECVNLGHPPPLLVDAKGSVRALQAGQNVALGMMDFAPSAECCRLEPEETAFLYTDGLLDPDYQGHDGRLPGQLASYVPLIASMSGSPMESICGRLSRCIGAGHGPITDDAAFLLARLQGDTEREPTHTQLTTTLRPRG